MTIAVRRLNYQHPLCFWAVVRAGSPTKACEELHLSAPTVSTQLRTFEERIGQKLLAKSGRRLVPTEVGRVVFSYADEIFALGGDLLSPAWCWWAPHRKCRHSSMQSRSSARSNILPCMRSASGPARFFPREPAAKHYAALRGATSPQPAQLNRLGRDDRGDLAADGAELVENPGHDLLDSC
jgi:hypothetical protein